MPDIDQNQTIDQAGHAELPPHARAELAHALELLSSGGGRFARTAETLGRVAGLAAAPVLHTLARTVGRRSPAASGVDVSSDRLASVVAKMMEHAFDAATLALPDSSRAGRRNAGAAVLTRGSKLAAIASGVVGGAAGLPGFVPDAAFTTLLILRSIAVIAAVEGEDLQSEAGRHACIEVFTLGAPVGGAVAAARARPMGTGPAGTEPEGYWTTRLLVQGTPLMSLIGQAAARFGVVLSEKLALQAVPLAGAAAGAFVNAAFLDYYRALAKGHFIIRRLERQYGSDVVRLGAKL